MKYQKSKLPFIKQMCILEKLKINKEYQTTILKVYLN